MKSGSSSIDRYIDRNGMNCLASVRIYYMRANEESKSPSPNQSQRIALTLLCNVNLLLLYIFYYRRVVFAALSFILIMLLFSFYQYLINTFYHLVKLLFTHSLLELEHTWWKNERERKRSRRVRNAENNYNKRRKKEKKSSHAALGIFHMKWLSAGAVAAVTFAFRSK